MKIATLWIAEKPSMAVAFAQALGIIDFKDASKGAYISDGGLVSPGYLDTFCET